MIAPRTISLASPTFHSRFSSAGVFVKRQVNVPSGASTEAFGLRGARARDVVAGRPPVQREVAALGQELLEAQRRRRRHGPADPLRRGRPRRGDEGDRLGERHVHGARADAEPVAGRGEQERVGIGTREAAGRLRRQRRLRVADRVVDGLRERQLHGAQRRDAAAGRRCADGRGLLGPREPGDVRRRLQALPGAGGDGDRRRAGRRPAPERDLGPRGAQRAPRGARGLAGDGPVERDGDRASRGARSPSASSDGRPASRWSGAHGACRPAPRTGRRGAGRRPRRRCARRASRAPSG